MEITKNKTVNVLLLNVLLPIVVTVVATVVIDKIKADNESTGGTKTASQPAQKVQETTETEVTETV
ncbi:hypothetical protein [Crocinitomix algicola]|uniref:hypothetical protein n=1 Tax=Crocinitomix algicola TaxID=1740263 RepID=UPI0008305DF3|nr:hypothetical protein [Crocinitomix algicola]